MTEREARIAIASEFIGKYVEWLTDHNNDSISDNEFGKKYGYGKSQDRKKDTQQNVLWFASHIFQGRYLYAWEKVGYQREVIYELHRNGFLSLQEYSDWKSRQLGKTDFYYLNNDKVRQIYKAYKDGFFTQEK